MPANQNRFLNKKHLLTFFPVVDAIAVVVSLAGLAVEFLTPTMTSAFTFKESVATIICALIVSMCGFCFGMLNISKEIRKKSDQRNSIELRKNEADL
jgi:lysylphosphatidylglycerol synthetase-like protein (DUF2156 family)